MFRILYRFLAALARVRFGRSKVWVPETRTWGFDQGRHRPILWCVYRILYRFLASLARFAVRSGRSKDMEIIVLRHQLAVLRRQHDRTLDHPSSPQPCSSIIQTASSMHGRSCVTEAANSSTPSTRSSAPRASRSSRPRSERRSRIRSPNAGLRRCAESSSGNPQGYPVHIIWNQHQLERLVTDYINHYNTHRPHQSLGQRPATPPDQPPATGLATVAVVRTSRCDELINEYQDAA